MSGKVYLIGMGPGDPGLITLKAVKAIEQCDVLIYDRLVNKTLLNYNKNAEHIYVGKTSGAHTLTQEEINRLLAEKAKVGHTVGRLKGGDPFVFGRGGEEALYLKSQGIHYEIIPGITSAIAVPMYAGIPVTHRGIATSFHVITGHEHGDKSDINWEALAQVKGTLIFLMGIENLQMIVDNLTTHGKSKDCPAALIMNGTRADQKEACGTLENIVDRCRESQIKSPAIILIGEVVSLHDKIAHPVQGSLSGLTILNTRPADKSEELTTLLKEKGAKVYPLPCIEIQAVEGVSIEKEKLESYDAIVFSSTYGVRYFMESLKKSRVDIRSLKGRLYGVGASVKEALEAYGLLDCIIPDGYNATELAKVIQNKETSDSTILMVSGDIGGERLAEGLKGYKVDKMTVYRTQEGCNETASEEIDCILFTSPSCVKGFLKKNAIEAFKDKLILCIGESTKEQVDQSGFSNCITSDKAAPQGIIEKLIEWRTNHA